MTAYKREKYEEEKKQYGCHYVSIRTFFSSFSFHLPLIDTVLFIKLKLYYIDLAY